MHNPAQNNLTSVNLAIGFTSEEVDQKPMDILVGLNDKEFISFIENKYIGEERGEGSGRGARREGRRGRGRRGVGGKGEREEESIEGGWRKKLGEKRDLSSLQVPALQHKQRGNPLKISSRRLPLSPTMLRPNQQRHTLRLSYPGTCQVHRARRESLRRIRRRERRKIVGRGRERPGYRNGIPGSLYFYGVAEVRPPL
jgi:hypothetical protein